MDSKEEIIWKESFFKENFNVDQCLSKFTLKSDLETLRNDLKNYANELHKKMAEILKTETEAIVNLAEYLTNLSSKIDDLSLPISQLREEVKILYDLIKSAQSSYKNTLDTIKSNKTKQNHLILKSAIISSAMYIDKMIKTRQDDLFEDSIILERAVNKFSFEYNYLEAFNLTSDIEEIRSVHKKLTEMVNKIFLNGIKRNDEIVLLRCLRMYENLGQQDEAEKTYQIKVVRPALKHLFTEVYLDKCAQNVDKIYEEALDFVENKMATLLSVLERNPELKSYSFILRSFWAEVDKQLREGLPYITAPGNPEMFQKRFQSTWKFLENISKKCGDENLIKTNESFEAHMKRFNLPVYFEICFQQIAGQFESDAVIKPGPNIYVGTNEIGCKLRITNALWKAMNLCFSKEIFIDNLADQFLKLSMLLLARYLNWFEVALKESDQFTNDAESWEDFIIQSLNDLNIIADLIGYENDKKIEQTIYTTMPNNTKPVLVEVLHLNTKTINAVSNKLQQHLIKIKTNESFIHLQNVASIPRLYRRTNRSAPKEASNYMIEAVQPVLKFYNKFKSLIRNELHVIFDVIITNVTQHYLSLVKDVLRSVCKTEESLRRLKNKTHFEAASDLDSSDTMSDEMKIREQIRLDVTYFIESDLVMENGREGLEVLKKQTQ